MNIRERINNIPIDEKLGAALGGVLGLSEALGATMDFNIGGPLEKTAIDIGGTALGAIVFLGWSKTHKFLESKFLTEDINRTGGD